MHYCIIYAVQIIHSSFHTIKTDPNTNHLLHMRLVTNHGTALGIMFACVNWFQSISAILDSASNDLLSECYRRSLKKISSLPDSNEEIDDTILT